jgi:sucrose phosphorylase
MQENKNISNGVMLNAYPDSIGEKFSDTIDMLKMTELRMFFLCYTYCPLF